MVPLQLRTALTWVMLLTAKLKGTGQVLKVVKVIVSLHALKASSLHLALTRA